MPKSSDSEIVSPLLPPCVSLLHFASHRNQQAGDINRGRDVPWFVAVGCVPDGPGGTSNAPKAATAAVMNPGDWDEERAGGRESIF